MAPPEAEDDSVNILDTLLQIWRRKWIVLLAALIGSALGVVAALEMEERYVASARVLFEPERIRIIDLDSVLVAPDSADGLQNQIEILRSANLLERVIDILRLESSPEFNPALRSEPPGLVERVVHRLGLPERWLQLLAKVGLMPPVEPTDMTAEERSSRLRTHVLEQLDQDLRLSPVRNSRVIQIGYSSTDPVTAATIANTVGEQYINVQAERKRDVIAAASETLSARVKDLENRLNSAEEAVRIAQLELTLESSYGTTLISKKLEFLSEALNEAQLTQSTLEKQHERVAAAVGDRESYVLLPEFRESPIMSEYRAREQALLEEKATIGSIVANERSLQLIQLDARLDAVRRNMQTEAGNIEKALAMRLEAARQRGVALAEDLKKLEGRAVEHAHSEMRIGRLEREAEAARVIYNTFLTRLQETREQASLQTPDATFLTRASPPLDPETTDELVVVAMGGLVGTAGGIGLVVLLEMMRSSFRGRDEIEMATGFPVLASIPMATGFRKRPRRLIRQILKRPDSALAESVRNLRTSLLFSGGGNPPKAIMFASSLPGEGKTTAALLMAVLSRQMGRSSIIVDCDLRRRTLTKEFSDANIEKGLVAVLEGKATLDEAVSVDHETGVHVLALESISATSRNPADLLSSDRFRNIVEILKSAYDLVVFDSPPVLSFADARILSQSMDSVVYLAAWGKTQKDVVIKGTRELTSVNARVAGIVLSLVSEARAADYAKKGSYFKKA